MDISFHCYADDTQMYLPLKQDKHCLDSLLSCLNDLKAQMAVNFQNINDNKTEMAHWHTESQKKKISALSLSICKTLCKKPGNLSGWCFEVWHSGQLSPSVLDTAVTPSDNFAVLRMDRTAEAGKIKGGGVCFMINKKWCDPRNISILSRSCSPHLEHLSIICRPFYLPREFSAVIATAVYIPPQADTSLALSKLHEELSGYINKHPDAASIIAGDFNKANLRKVMPNFHQHVSCPTRGPNTLDHCYTQF